MTDTEFTEYELVDYLIMALVKMRIDEKERKHAQTSLRVELEALRAELQDLKRHLETADTAVSEGEGSTTEDPR